MNINSTTFTAAEYCQQYADRQLVINRDYQRSRTVWPTSARSYLIDTILCGYPIPKILLRQITDLRNRRTYKEIVDGQQRTAAIVDFFNDNLVLSSGAYKGNRFSSLQEDDPTRFIKYVISADIFSEATDEDVREVFRRINSYTVPLNYQEHRHATHQGAFKWFIVALSQKYAEAFKNMGVLSEQQLSRMADSELLTEFVRFILFGIETQAKTKLDALYKDYDPEFREEDRIAAIIDEALSVLLALRDLHNTALFSRGNTYSLFAAVSHAQNRFPNLYDLVMISLSILTRGCYITCPGWPMGWKTRIPKESLANS